MLYKNQCSRTKLARSIMAVCSFSTGVGTGKLLQSIVLALVISDDVRGLRTHYLQYPANLHVARSDALVRDTHWFSLSFIRIHLQDFLCDRYLYKIQIRSKTFIFNASYVSVSWDE